MPKIPELTGRVAKVLCSQNFQKVAVCVLVPVVIVQYCFIRNTETQLTIRISEENTTFSKLAKLQQLSGKEHSTAGAEQTLVNSLSASSHFKGNTSVTSPSEKLPVCPVAPYGLRK